MSAQVIIHKISFFRFLYVGVVVVGSKGNWPLMKPGPIGGMPSVGDFLRDPSPYLSEFRRKARKTPSG